MYVYYCPYGYLYYRLYLSKPNSFVPPAKPSPAQPSSSNSPDKLIQAQIGTPRKSLESPSLSR